jgi:hypothetical protein
MLLRDARLRWHWVTGTPLLLSDIILVCHLVLLLLLRIKGVLREIARMHVGVLLWNARTPLLLREMLRRGLFWRIAARGIIDPVLSITCRLWSIQACLLDISGVAEDCRFG